MARNNHVPKTFCTTREASELLGVSLRTAQLWAESGLLEAWKTGGGHRRITRQSIERLLANPAVRGLGTEEPQQRRADDPGRNVSPPPFNVLVVEDDPALRRLYEVKLRSWPMRPTLSSTGDGYEALIRMGNVKPDLLIADLNMPGMDGFRMLQAITSAPELSATSIVVVSGLDPEEIARRGGLPPGIPVLPKPVPFARLLAIAERVVLESKVPA